MQIRLEPTQTDSRIFEVRLDFSGQLANDFFLVYGPSWHRRRARAASEAKLDELLKTLKLNRISHWKHEWPKYSRLRINVYWTTVISDRDL